MQKSNFLFGSNTDPLPGDDKFIQFTVKTSAIMAGPDLHVIPASVSLGARFLQFVAIPWAWTSCIVTLML
jgi:hypothetical protein